MNRGYRVLVAEDEATFGLTVARFLEERGHFEVYRLVSSTPEVWKVQAIAFPKVDFEGWFAKQPR